MIRFNASFLGTGEKRTARGTSNWLFFSIRIFSRIFQRRLSSRLEFVKVRLSCTVGWIGIAFDEIKELFYLRNVKLCTGYFLSGSYSIRSPDSKAFTTVLNVRNDTHTVQFYMKRRLLHFKSVTECNINSRNASSSLDSIYHFTGGFDVIAFVKMDPHV